MLCWGFARRGLAHHYDQITAGGWGALWFCWLKVWYHYLVFIMAIHCNDMSCFLMEYAWPWWRFSNQLIVFSVTSLSWRGYKKHNVYELNKNHVHCTSHDLPWKINPSWYIHKLLFDSLILASFQQKHVKLIVTS